MRKIYLILGLAFLFLLGCENHLEMTLPEGPQGEQGPQGKDGLSAFDLWKIFYQKGPNATFEDFMNSLRGKDGKDGAVPIIGANGNWYINGIDTNIPARGVDGKDGVTPQIGKNNHWFIDGVDTGIPAIGKDGADGHTPVIGANGNWHINGSDTGMPAVGKNGKDGIDGITPQIGGDGNWWIGCENTGVPATGKDGKPGIQGVTPNIGANGNWYIDGCDTGVPASGKAGADGVTPVIGGNGNWHINGKDTGVRAKGKDGKDGVDGVTPVIGGNGNWYIDGKDTGVPAKGKNGKDGVDGVTPVIGGNGNWYIDGKDTGVRAKGKNGKDGVDGITPSIGGNGNWYIDGKDTGVPARGKDGITPIVGGNGNWWIDGKDTSVPARGANGIDGVSPVVGSNGNWWIGNNDTGVPARGVDGIDGITPSIGSNGNWWINGKDTGQTVKGLDGIDGVTPTIGSNGNWYIDGKDTGIKAKGQDGSDGQAGKDGITPLIGWNGNWFIGGVDTNVPAKGTNGKDGLDGVNGVNGVTPTIGTNGNWWFGSTDTGVKAKGIDGINGVIPEIGSNGNWYINGKDTGVLAKGQDGNDGADGNDGVNGKTSYELWKEAVDAGDMTNKDGSPYTGGNSWEAFLKWLQGGEISVLHQYWLKQGNTGDLQAFIEALFDCHCDGITVAVFAPNDCLDLDASGNILTIPNATLTVGAEAGTKVQITGEGITAQDKTVLAGASEVKFTIARTAEDQFVMITNTLPGGETADQISKNARIPALKYVKFGSATVAKVTDEEKDVASITFETAPAELYVNSTIVYNDATGIVAGSGWIVSADKKTFTKTFERKASVQKLSFKAIGDDNGCSVLKSLLEIPQLTPVVIDGEPVVSVTDCDIQVVLKGTSGMTVVATPSYSGATPVTMTEGPSGVYTTSNFSRKFAGYTIDISAAKAGAGTVTKKVVVGGNMLLPANPFTVSYGASESSDPTIIATFSNLNNKNVEVVITRSANSVPSKGKERAPWVNDTPGINNSKTVNIPANGSVSLKFNKDFANDFSAGYYTVTMETISFCGESFKLAKRIDNQRDFGYSFRRITEQPEGYPSGPGGSGAGSNPYDPEYGVPVIQEGYTIFEVSISDAIPNSYAQFLLNTSDGFGPVWSGGAKQTDANGNLKILVKMKNSDIAIANGKKGEIKLSKEKISSEFLQTKELTFNLPL